MNVNLKLVYLLGVIEVILLTLVGIWYFRMQPPKDAVKTTPGIEAPAQDENPQPTPELSNPETPATALPADCHRAGCSNELCTDKDDVMSTCIWNEAYACYKDAECKRQNNGKCGFTITPELTQCVKEKTAAQPAAPASKTNGGTPQPW